jgi:DUF2905 family protein
MAGLENLGRILMMAGAVLLGLGALLAAGRKIGWLGRLPGDFHIQRGGFSLCFPLATCLILSLALTLILVIIRRH